MNPLSLLNNFNFPIMNNMNSMNNISNTNIVTYRGK